MSEVSLDVQAFNSIGVKTTDDEGRVHRRVVLPGSDLSGEAKEVAELAAKLWTPEVLDEWEAYVKANEPEDGPTRRKVRKSTVQARLIASDLMNAAYAALTANPVFFARWFAPDQPEVYADDPDAALLLTTIGADPAAIMAEEV